MVYWRFSLKPRFIFDLFLSSSATDLPSYRFVFYRRDGGGCAEKPMFTEQQNQN